MNLFDSTLRIHPPFSKQLNLTNISPTAKFNMKNTNNLLLASPGNFKLPPREPMNPPDLTPRIYFHPPAPPHVYRTHRKLDCFNRLDLPPKLLNASHTLLLQSAANNICWDNRL